MWYEWVFGGFGTEIIFLLLDCYWSNRRNGLSKSLKQANPESR